MRLLLELKTNNKIQNLKVHLIAYLSLKNFFFTLTANVSPLQEAAACGQCFFRLEKTKLRKKKVQITVE